MKLLVVSNFYPPHKIGGYELLCKEVMQALKQRGHEFKVLTSTYGVEIPVVEEDIHRELFLEGDLHFYSLKDSWNYPWRRASNLRKFQEIVHNYQPDLVFFWGLWALSKNIAVEAERIMPSRVVYYFANPWPIQPSLHKLYWDDQAKDPWRKIIKRALRAPVRVLFNDEWVQPKLDYKYSPICSQAMKNQLVEAGIPLAHAPVIYEGINLPPYLHQAANRSFNDAGKLIKLLYVGIIAPHKGVHTAVEALTGLEDKTKDKFQLTILGTGHPEYETRLRELVITHKLEKHVVFHEPIPRSELPEFLGKFDVLLIPSIWEEPLALIMQEGLAAGMVVIGSSTGGTKEIIHDDENGLLFTAGDDRGLANQLRRVLSEPALMHRLSEQGRKTAEEKFDINRMVSEIDSILQKAAVK